MKKNPMRAGVERGEALIGTWLNLFHQPAMLPLLKSAGLDFARVDMEHAAASIETVAQLALMARAIDFPIAVRPPHANREWITRLLDIGVWNLHCPQVESAAHAREIVAASRYAPRGLRGNGGLGPATDFEIGGAAAEQRAFANEQVFVTVMLETGAAFDDLDEIAAMDGIDALTLGPADLAQDLGVMGKPEQARVLDEHRDRIVAAAQKHGKTCAMLVSSAEEARRWRDAGVLLLAYSNDVAVVHEAFRSAMARIKT
jgi:2-keto-3-deoxy-L-rhamnonate aldolase RhmA